MDPLMEDPGCGGRVPGAGPAVDDAAASLCQPVLPVGQAVPLRHAAIRGGAAGVSAGDGDLQLDLRQCGLHQRHDGCADLGVRHGDAAGGRVPGFRASGDRAVPGDGDPGALCQRVCVAVVAAGFPCRVRGVSGWAGRGRLVSVRPHADDGRRWAGADRDRAGCGGCGVLLDLRRCRFRAAAGVESTGRTRPSRSRRQR